MFLMLCAPLDWQYAELPSSASDAVLCSVLVRKMWDISLYRIKKIKKIIHHFKFEFTAKAWSYISKPLL